MAAQSSYPQPKDVGGSLIRRLVAEFRQVQMGLPLDSHILIALSGGSDSLALSHLILKYGRRLADLSKVTLLHVNHGWRGEESDEDERFVQAFGRDWGVAVRVHRLPPVDLAQMRGESWEERAREARKAVFESEANRLGARVLTAHTADDLAETVLWRIFTGGAQTHGGGIAVCHGVEFRPLLQVRKSELQAYLREEGQIWREDLTNFSGRLLRSRMRRELMPKLEGLFPQAVDHLVDLALQAQRRADQKLKDNGNSQNDALGTLFDVSGLRARRAHWVAIQEDLKKGRGVAMDLPDGWRLSAQSVRDGRPERWVLERSGM